MFDNSFGAEAAVTQLYPLSVSIISQSHGDGVVCKSLNISIILRAY